VALPVYTVWGLLIPRFRNSSVKAKSE